MCTLLDSRSCDVMLVTVSVDSVSLWLVCTAVVCCVCLSIQTIFIAPLRVHFYSSMSINHSLHDKKDYTTYTVAKLHGIEDCNSATTWEVKTDQKAYLWVIYGFKSSKHPCYKNLKLWENAAKFNANPPRNLKTRKMFSGYVHAGKNFIFQSNWFIGVNLGGVGRVATPRFWAWVSWGSKEVLEGSWTGLGKHYSLFSQRVR